jgi:hypothetical protein
MSLAIEPFLFYRLLFCPFSISILSPTARDPQAITSVERIIGLGRWQLSEIPVGHHCQFFSFF